ncbi:hypothetical protein RM844_16855 [Streptomyces sp. DSM 44915]|uniref:Recombination endonuclease VII n=1 Tax=Streptomyces chisholmiae TaxID=3075540 RepID=A0ABU2JT66_9ACTN|nr:hypothetical protein [Streptomyces sp. DSM 44915]MDT0267951.1 hypothetical protein [Streptomyces sp. DSM 44915]
MGSVVDTHSGTALGDARSAVSWAVMSRDANDKRKECTGCQKVKPLADFPMRTTRGVKRPSRRCAACLREAARERQRRYRTENAAQVRETRREAKRRYGAVRLGVSPDRAEELRAGSCGICRRSPEEGCQLYADPETGAVLGALCPTCLRGLAMLGGTQERVRAALAFVQSGTDLRDAIDPQAVTQDR